MALLLVAAGLVVLAGVWIVGLATGNFLVHVAFPLGVWLTADGVLARLGQRPLVERPDIAVPMIGIGAGLGLLLDFHMVALTNVLDLTAVTTPALALAMYLGWGLAMPAVYSSFRLARLAVGGDEHETDAAAVPASLIAPLALLGLALAEVALFFHLWVAAVPGWFVAPVFAGLWLLAEYVQARRRRPSLLGALLVGDVRPLGAMVLAALPFTLLWEGLNALMTSWHYQNIFWLEPQIAGVPLVVFFGYLCGYYVLFLSVYGAVRTEDESEWPLYLVRPDEVQAAEQRKERTYDRVSRRK